VRFDEAAVDDPELMRSPPGIDLAVHGLIQAERRPEIPGGGPQSVAAVLDAPLAADPTAEALVGRSGRLCFGELDVAANRAANALAALGIGPGDRVAVCLPNDVDIVVAFLGAMRLGALWVGINRVLAAPEKAYQLSDSGACALLATRDVAESLEPHRAGLSALRDTVCIEPGAGGDPWASRLAAADASRPGVSVDPFAPAAIAYTSGTTGFPKGAVHSQHNLLLPGAVSRHLGRYPAGQRMGVVLPLTILNLMVLGPLSAWQHGCCCVAIDRIDPEGLAGWIRDERVGSFAGVPTIFHDLLTHPDVEAADLASLVTPEVGGAECPEEFRALYRQRFGAEVRVGYGMTEAPTAVTWSDGSAAPEPGLCGRALPQVEILILDEGGSPCAPGEVGEICVAPARKGAFAGVYTPMLGYWNRPEVGAEALRAGVYHSGDLGVLDRDGTLFIRGRRNELILRGGANVYPAEVERALQELPGVAGCAVLGLPDARLGQRVVAAVESEPGASLSEEALREGISQRLARYKVPERIALVESLPRNAMSKVVKRALEPLFEDAEPIDSPESTR
jgi:acyl-CoA synthetase (AMP-forming)/AMP-acid ligase II